MTLFYLLLVRIPSSRGVYINMADPMFPGNASSSILAGGGPRKSGSRRTTNRRNGDVQYGFRVTILGAAISESNPGYKYQLRWKRGDKLQGKTAPLECDDAQTVTWNYEATFTSTIQKKDATRLHKKVMNFLIAEFRPRDGKYDKKTYEGGFNLASATTADELGHMIPQTVHSVKCGGGAITLRLLVSATPKSSGDSNSCDLMTDVPITDAGPSMIDGDVPTERSIDDVDDDLSASDTERPVVPRNRSPPPKIPTQNGGGGGVSMKEHIKLAEENRLLKKEVESLKAQAIVASGQVKRLRDEAKKAKKESRGDTTQGGIVVQKQFLDEIFLVVNGVLVPSDGPPVSSTIMKALVNWDALSVGNNTNGEPNTFLINCISAIDSAIASCKEDQSSSIKWLSTLWTLLSQVLTLSNSLQIERFNLAVGSHLVGDFAGHLFVELRVPPVVSGDRPSQMLIERMPESIPVLTPNPVDVTLDSNIYHSFVAHLICAIRDTAMAVLHPVMQRLDIIIPALLAGSCGDTIAVKEVLSVLTELITLLKNSSINECMLMAAMRAPFSHIDLVIFGSMLKEKSNCTDIKILYFKEVISTFEGWMRQYKVIGKPPSSRNVDNIDSGCRGSLNRTRQACDLILLRGGTVSDPALWNSIPATSLLVLLQNVVAPAGEGVPDAIMQQVISLSKGDRKQPQSCSFVLPKLSSAANDDWKRDALPAGLATRFRTWVE